MHIQTYQFTDRSLENQMTDVKNMLITWLYNKDYLNGEQADDLRDNFAVIVRKPSFFWRLINAARRKMDKNPLMILVRQESLHEPQEDKPPVKLVVAGESTEAKEVSDDGDKMPDGVQDAKDTPDDDSKK